MIVPKYNKTPDPAGDDDLAAAHIHQVIVPTRLAVAATLAPSDPDDTTGTATHYPAIMVVFDHIGHALGVKDAVQLLEGLIKGLEEVAVEYTRYEDLMAQGATDAEAVAQLKRELAGRRPQAF